MCIIMCAYLALCYHNLQPDINQFSSQLLPSLLDYLAHVTSCDTVKEQGEAKVSLTRTFYALEKFCESLGKNCRD